ncbi:hypothetical protein ABLO15_06485 [Mycobacterium tuberculosis]
MTAAREPAVFAWARLTAAKAGRGAGGNAGAVVSTGPVALAARRGRW